MVGVVTSDPGEKWLQEAEVKLERFKRREAEGVGAVAEPPKRREVMVSRDGLG